MLELGAEMVENETICKKHAGLQADIENLKIGHNEHKKSFLRLWNKIEEKISMKVFLSVASIAVTILALMMSLMFSGQDKILMILQANQNAMLEKVAKLMTDVEIIKREARAVEGKTR